ncbi:MAG: hypothetical protein CM1200mP22_22450 [Dehalococcoidia bacterium]|nr:MAG: hypothetical protein CM1200mP22_22450 [Dehalococcoidia bacterium]
MLHIYNTLAKRVEEIQPATPGFIEMYTCGPTVYRDAHIGNMRTYIMADWTRAITDSQRSQSNPHQEHHRLWSYAPGIGGGRRR